MENHSLNLITPHQFYEELNTLLDTPIGIHKVYALIKKKDFPSVRIGNRFYVLRDEVAEWLKKQTGMRKN